MELEAGAEFKIVAPIEGGFKWFGGLDENQVGYFLITPELLEQGIELMDGANFRISEAGNYNIKLVEVATPLKGLGEPIIMTVTKNTPEAITTIGSDVKADNAWYNLQGVKLNAMPTVPGIYIMGGKKVIIK